MVPAYHPTPRRRKKGKRRPGMGTGGLETLAGEAELAIAGHSEHGYDLVLNYEIG